MLPGFIIMLLIAWAYTAVSPAMALFAGAFFGVQAAIVGVIIRAVHRIGAHILENGWLWAICVAGFGATLLSVDFWIVLLVGGTAYVLLASGRSSWAAALVVAASCLAAGLRISQPETFFESGGEDAARGALAMLWTGVKAGLLTFGGAYTAIPYVRTDTVERGLIGDGQFLDGIAFAGVIPAPLVIFCTFVGFVVGGWSGAIAMTVGVFFPAFAFSMIFYERLESIVGDERLHRFLAGVAAGVVGIIAATSLQLGWATLQRVPSVPIAAAIMLFSLAAVSISKSRYVVAGVLTLSAIAGWLMF